MSKDIFKLAHLDTLYLFFLFVCIRFLIKIYRLKNVITHLFELTSALVAPGCLSISPRNTRKTFSRYANNSQ